MMITAKNEHLSLDHKEHFAASAPQLEWNSDNWKKPA